MYIGMNNAQQPPLFPGLLNVPVIGSVVNAPVFTRLLNAPIAGTAHYYLMRFSIYMGARVAETPLDLSSYVLMHTIGTVFAESVKGLCNLGMYALGDSKEENKPFLRKCAWGLIGIPQYGAKKVDLVYSYVFGIRTGEEADKVPDRELWTTEIVRKVFFDTILEMTLYISSWEIGKRAAELLLKCTILTFMPSTAKIYTFHFIYRLAMKVMEFKGKVLVEQEAHMHPIFDDKVSMIEEHFQALKKYTKKKELGTPEFEKQITLLYTKISDDTMTEGVELNEMQRLLVVQSLYAEFANTVVNFEDYWIKFPSNNIDSLLGLVQKYDRKLFKLENSILPLQFSEQATA